MVCGSVDHGKSTLLGRLLYDADLLAPDQLTATRRAATDPASRAADAGFDLAFVTDGLRAERAEGITIDVAHRAFRTPRRAFLAADAPGHVELTRNMVSGASTARLALLVVDATIGPTTQTRRHVVLCSLLGVQRLVLCVNKLDLVEEAEPAFAAAREALEAFARRLEPLGLGGVAVSAVPLSAKRGDNVVQRSARTPWYSGPPLLELLETVAVAPRPTAAGLRLPIQLVLGPRDAPRFAGRVEAGLLRDGDEVVVLPSGHRTRVTGVHGPSGRLTAAPAPLSVTLALADPAGAARGDLLASPEQAPQLTQRLDLHLVWLGEAPLDPARRYRIKHGTRTTPGVVERIEAVIDPDTLTTSPAAGLRQNDVARVTLRTDDPLPVDPRPAPGSRVILIDPDTHDTVAAGVALAPAPAPVVWLTGLSGAGKSTLARALADACDAAGVAATVIDADQVRATLSRDLGFTPADRRENVRRISSLAAETAAGGTLAIVACIAPYAESRRAAAALVDPARFVLVHVSTPLAVCQARDPKGLYARAAAGELAELTGVSAPYEVPTAPALRIDTSETSVEAAVAQLLAATLPGVGGASAI